MPSSGWVRFDPALVRTSAHLHVSSVATNGRLTQVGPNTGAFGVPAMYVLG